MKVIILAVLVACAAAAPAPIEDGVDISPSDNVQVLVNGVPDGHALDIEHILGIELNEQTDDAAAVSSNVLQPLSAAAIAEAAAAAPQEIAALPELIFISDDPSALPAPVVLPEAALPAPVVLPEAALPAPIVLPEAALPAPIVLPGAPAPEVVETPLPAPIVLPGAPAPEVVGTPLPAPIVLPGAPAPEVVETPLPAPIVLPEPVAPEVVETPLPAPIVLPEPVAPEVVVPGAIPEQPDTPVSGDIYNDGLVQVTVNTPEDQGILTTLSSWMSLAISYVTGGVQTTSQIV